ncbi:MAG: 3',5'-cyclic-AMP phosphodiesterase [Enterobacterales bacterium]|nr:3',5'-cyclic-AMP phosphodiesterase [Enterobacterales bacterium]
MNQFQWDTTQLKIAPKGTTPKVLQITAPHIFKDEAGCLLGLNTRRSLNAVLDDVYAYHRDADLILATGDISQDHSLESYNYFAKSMNKLGLPVAWVPGNHDISEFMAPALSGQNFVTNKRISIGEWDLILLDSSVEDAVFGQLGAQQLDFLEACLRAPVGKYAMPVLHHHPVDIGCDWMTPIGLHDADAMFKIIDQFNHVKVILWGHIHQEFDIVKSGVRLLATPSSSVQFKPGSTEFSAGTESPGYRTMKLQSNGSLSTAVHRIEHIEFTVDYTIKGY